MKLNLTESRFGVGRLDVDIPLLRAHVENWMVANESEVQPDTILLRPDQWDRLWKVCAPGGMIMTDAAKKFFMGYKVELVYV